MAGIIPQQRVSYFNNTPYIDNRMDYSNSAFSQLGARANMLETQNMPWLLQRKQLIPLQPQQPAAQPADQGAGNGMMTGKLPDMYNRLTMQANDALYGGILGYQPKPITSPTGNQYQPPTNQGFQFPFGLLNRNFLGS
jgi:hypothetical protein